MGNSLAGTPVGRSARTPTGRPTKLRHWIAYHSPDIMGYEFFECRGFAVLTDKWLRDLKGDIVWVIGRLGGTHRYFLDSRFRVDAYEHCGGDSRFKYRVSGQSGFAFFPVPEVTRKPWFHRLRAQMNDFSVGLQAMHDEEVLRGLASEYAASLEIQNSSSPAV